MAVQRKVNTLAEYHEFVVRPENVSRIFELVEGEFVEKLPSFLPSKIAITIAFYLKLYLQQHSIGTVTGADGGYRMSEENVFVPGVGFISSARLETTPEREVPVPPDLAVEVKSPTDSKRELRAKAEKYLAFGTTMVWLVFPEEKRVEVYVPGADVAELTAEDTITGGGLLPGFSLRVADIFQQ